MVSFSGLSTDSNGTSGVEHVLCAGNHSNFGGKTECAVESHGASNLYYALFILGMIVAGVGNSPLNALGVPYMDQNVKNKVSPMYLGIFVGFGGILGKEILNYLVFYLLFGILKLSFARETALILC